MQGRTGFAVRLPMAALAFAASAIALAPASDAAPAETCLRAPKGVAPQGSHWYYRIDRPTQRKCWYLADKGRSVAQRSEARRTPPQAEPDDDDATPAPVAAPPVAAAPTAAAAAPAANVAPQPVAEAPAPKITTLVTRNVSNADQPAQAPIVQAQPAPAPVAQDAAPPAPWPAPVAEAPAAAPAQAPIEQPTPRVIAEPPPAPVAAPESPSATPATTPTLLLVLGAIALLGFVASAVFFIMALRRRRNDVLNMRREADVLPYEHSPEMAGDDGATFQPLRALDPIRRRDDVDEAVRRVMRRRRAAAAG